jgi:predicted dienelactone hydrolase
MRGLEMALIAVDGLILVFCVRGSNSTAVLRWLAPAAILLLVVQVAVEGHRWTMYPAYLVTVWLFAARAWRRPGSSAPRIWTTLAGIAGLLGAVPMSCALPVFDFPRPTGPCPVGSATRHLIDAGREESHEPGRGAPRELMIQIWYPAEHAGPRQPYRQRDEVSLFKKHLSLIRTNAAAGVPVASTPDRHPVLIFSPSWVGKRAQNTVQAEEMASHGYVVVGIDHPYATPTTTFPDGRMIESTLGNWMDFSSEDAMQKAIRVAESELEIRTADVRFVLNSLERLDRSDPAGLLTGRLDLSRVGVFGHSFGGAVAAEACRVDPRFRVAIDYDGCLFGGAAREGVPRPFLVLSDGNPSPTPVPDAAPPEKRRRFRFLDQDVRDIHRSIETYGGYLLALRGASHANYCDTPLFLPIRRMSEAGSIPCRRAFEIINDCTVAFFDEFVKGEGRAFPDASLSRYSELVCCRCKPPIGAVPAPQ